MKFPSVRFVEVGRLEQLEIIEFALGVAIRRK